VSSYSLILATIQEQKMDRHQIPASLHCMIPVAEELLEQHERDASAISLSEQSKALLNKRFTHNVRRELEDWIGSSDTEEAKEFCTVMVLLDELGLLENTEPSLNYEFWRAELTSVSWGNVRGAAQQIAEGYLPKLSKQELFALEAQVEELLQSSENANSRIWLTWLRCQIDKDLDIGRDYLRKVINESPSDCDEQLDMVVDACCALVTLPHASQQDLEAVVRFVLDDRTDEFNAAATLEAYLSSPYVTPALKNVAANLARQAASEELRHVAETWHS
jgi:hypothetical protein